MSTAEQNTVPDPSTVIEFVVWGVAQPGGSKRSLPIPKRGGGFVTNDRGFPVLNTVDDNAKAKPWQADVKAAAMQAYHGPVLDGAVRLSLTFVRVRPKGHFRTGKNAHLLRDGAPDYPTSKPDCTKLVRCLEDALAGIVWRDDAQVVYQCAEKVYGDRPCVVVRIEEIARRVGEENGKII